MLRRLLATLTVIIGAVSPFLLHAQTVTIDNRQIHLIYPPGYCAASEGGREGKIVQRMQQMTRPNSQLLTLFVRCGDLLPARLDAVIAVDGFEDYGAISVPFTNGRPQAIETRSRTAFLTMTLAAVTAQPNVVASYFNAAEKRLQQVRPGTGQNLGIIDKDDNAIYFGILYVAHDAGGGADRTSISVGGYTLVKGVTVTMTIVHPYKTVADLRTSLADSKATLARLVAANE